MFSELFTRNKTVIIDTDNVTKFTERIAAFIIGLMLLFVLLITSTQALCFWLPDWWRSEYIKYDTPSKVNGEMSLNDAVKVTEDMLNYCVGKLDTLEESEATIDGVSKPFFTEREKSHLADCRELFMKGMRARWIALLLSAGLFIYLYVHRGAKQAAAICAKGYLQALAAAMILATIVGMASIIDFTAVFTLFHKLFFDNDLWILYPSEDNLINIMQEEVFSDAAKNIAGMWIITAGLLAIAAGLILSRRNPEH